MFDNKYPYTDFHELNLDWFLEQFKEYEAKVIVQDGKMATMEETVEQFTTFVTNYFNNLNVQHEINNKLNTMAADGTLIELIQPYYDQIVASQNQRIGTLETTATGLQNQINEIVAPEGDPTLTEVSNARVDLDGVTHPTLKARCDSDAQKVVNLNSDFSNSTGNGEIVVNTSGGLRCATSPVNFTDVIVTNNYKYTILNVSAGDQFRITGGSISATARLYCFTDDNGVIKLVADNGESANDLLLTAPEGSTKLILNNSLLASPAFKATYGDYIKNQLNAVKNTADTAFNTTVVTTSDKTPVTLSHDDGYLLNLDGTTTSYQTGWWVTDFTDISGFENLIVSAMSGYNHLLYAFYDSGEIFISGESSGSDLKTIVNQSVQIPPHAKYIKISGVYHTQVPVLIGVNNIRYANNALVERWKGKKWVVIGDSLTEVNSTSNVKYYDYIRNESGIETDVQAHSGTGYANPGNTDNFLTRMRTIPTDGDVYTIFGSFNDYDYSILNNIPIGDSTDIGTSTLCGYMNSTISALTTRVPLANIGIVSPCPWVSINSYNNAGNGFGSDYSNALKAIAERWSIAFLDLYNCSGLRPWSTAFQNLAYTKDPLNGVHPDETGHKILSTKFKEFLEMLLA